MIESVLDMDATGIAKVIKNGETTSFHVTCTYVEHIKKINPAINAMVEERFTDALNEAKIMDEQLTMEKRKDDCGVPISVKEAYNAKNMKTTGGLLNREGFIARKDAAVVKPNYMPCRICKCLGTTILNNSSW